MTQVNVRLDPDEVMLVDQIRRSAGTGVSRAQVLRSLVRERRRSVLDAQIAAAYDAAAPDDDLFGEGALAASGEALADL